jgi:putative ABC transport system permease protein
LFCTIPLEPPLISLRNLLRNTSRSILTICGAALGIAVYVSIQAITGNITRETQDVISSYDTDIMVQSKGASTPSASRIRTEELTELQSMFGTRFAPLVIGTLREAWNPYALMLGVEPAFAGRFGLIEGRTVVKGERELMVGVLAARQLGITVGQKLSLGNNEYSVCGIYTIGSNIIDGAVVVDMDDAKKIVGAEGYVHLGMIRVDKKGDTPQIVANINRRFSRLKAQPSADFMGNIRLFKVVETFVGAVGIITFLGACLVVTNTLLMSVAERTKEIGILMAVGWSPVLLLRMLFAESLILCLCGALFGNGLALMILRLLSGSRTIGFGWIPVTIPVTACATSLGVAVLLAIFSLIWPAVIVYRISPAEALRHE